MWMAFAGTEPLQDSIHEDDPGMCMLFLMEHHPCEVGRDFLSWLDMRHERADNAVRALFSLTIANQLKEDYLEFVAGYIENVGCYKVLYSTITIKEVETEGEE